MSAHRLLCGLGIHFWARLDRHVRGCAVCFQQQRFYEDAASAGHGFWADVPPIGKATLLGKSFHESGEPDPPAEVQP